VKLPIIGILSGVALATLGASAARAVIVIPPTGLNPGDQYRLVFVTSGARDATSSNIADYNTFVTNAARNSSVLDTALTNAGFNPLAINWTAIASTSAVNARVNTQTQATDTSRPIYRLDGALVATSYTDLWDGFIGYPINVTESGTSIAGTPGTAVWTGTLQDGTSPGSQLGSLGEVSVRGFVGFVPDTEVPVVDFRWVNSGGESSANFLPVYGISSVLTVPTAPPAATPEPSSLLGFITLGGLMLGGVARKTRK
jgi:hypothetical protein